MRRYPNRYGANVASGTTTDEAVVTDDIGTLSSKLRGLVKWAFERMPTSLGQKVATDSLPVVLASDQPAITVSTEGLTNAQLRATPVPISGTVTTGGLTDTQLRASVVPVSLPSTEIADTLVNILAELRVQNTILHCTLNSRDDLARLRNDALNNTIN
ncbi:hypothetical protein UFOVP1528_35 [uncultured Caudovirales phage]|uniref:Uncharacterized protein n=1 Tax=uncultured Caudovirales phage TaxID=2100421 RepID=A0A6J5SFE3_9CAUD|nr:hypothetical protein UFOVP905_40 [uncultured Caudovirales phage]CAB4182922.1 hypothetical protein UFOVP1080_28 [uncultured Caudovirales phage]CAB4197341.1 hypothetical protein UFOVP1321_16 [uncultured Caudovirales phage]CAB4212906.1 hypothetical protein UFOVP1432_47 [uncultured Caudovirales phage]CAB5227407.1 hypothetical protein UFOVP1528_35 [uncultured Caudovirales phage]